MNISRQSERRARFLSAFSDMPRFETWETEHEALPEGFTIEEAIPVIVKRQHVKLIPRSVRRDMARHLSRHQYRVDHSLHEPR